MTPPVHESPFARLAEEIYGSIKARMPEPLFESFLPSPPAQLQKALELAETHGFDRSSDTVADLGVSFGTVLTTLAKSGFRVLGIEKSAMFSCIADNLWSAHAPDSEIPLVHGSFFDPDSFTQQTIGGLSLQDSKLFYLHSGEKNFVERVLTEALGPAGGARPGSLIALVDEHQVDPDVIAKAGMETVATDPETNVTLLRKIEDTPRPTKDAKTERKTRQHVATHPGRVIKMEASCYSGISRLEIEVDSPDVKNPVAMDIADSFGLSPDAKCTVVMVLDREAGENRPGFANEDCCYAVITTGDRAEVAYDIFRDDVMRFIWEAIEEDATLTAFESAYGTPSPTWAQILEFYEIIPV